MTKDQVNMLKGIMVAKGVSTAELAKIMGITPHTLYQKMSVSHLFTRTEMDKIRKKLELTDAQVVSIFFDQ